MTQPEHSDAQREELVDLLEEAIYDAGWCRHDDHESGPIMRAEIGALADILRKAGYRK